MKIHSVVLKMKHAGRLLDGHHVHSMHIVQVTHDRVTMVPSKL